MLFIEKYIKFVYNLFVELAAKYIGIYLYYNNRLSAAVDDIPYTIQIKQLL